MFLYNSKFDFTAKRYNEGPLYFIQMRTIGGWEWKAARNGTRLCFESIYVLSEFPKLGPLDHRSALNLMSYWLLSDNGLRLIRKTYGSA